MTVLLDPLKNLHHLATIGKHCLSGASILTALVLAFGSANGGEVRGVAFSSLAKCPIAALPVVAVPENVAQRFTNLVTLSRMAADRSGNLPEWISELQQEKTKLLYRKMFSEIGPAERQAIDGTVTSLNNSIAFLEQMVTNRCAAMASLHNPAWPGVLARAHTGVCGEFVLSNLPPSSAVWIVAGPNTNKLIWVVPVPAGKSPLLFLSETNQIRLP